MVDKKDLKIIDILQENSRTPYLEIARRLRVSESTIRKRVKVLEERGVIKNYTVLIDPSKIGYDSTAIIGFDVDPSKLLEVAQKMTELEEVKCVATSSGDHMIMTEIWAKNGKELSQIISKKIGSIRGVKRICPAIILEKLKG
jgi:Lrp/AsnC family transcriptional regulator for asnA, asnC and gidA